VTVLCLSSGVLRKDDSHLLSTINRWRYNFDMGWYYWSLAGVDACPLRGPSVVGFGGVEDPRRTRKFAGIVTFWVIVPSRELMIDSEKIWQ
jgi:hypothetical protein